LSGFGGPILGITGTLVGSYFGGPFGAAVGGTIGSQVGNAIWPPDSASPPKPDFQLPQSTPNQPLPMVFGTVPVNKVHIDFTSEPVFKKIKESTKGGQEVTVGFEIFASFGGTVCEGPATIIELYRNGHLGYGINTDTGVLDSFVGELRTYDGTNPQDPDPTEEEIFGIEETSGYPGVTRFTLTLENLTDGFPVITATVTEVVTPAPPSKLIADNAGDMSFSTISDDGLYQYGYDDRGGGNLWKINLQTQEFEVWRSGVSEVNQQSTSDTSPAGGDQNNSAPAIGVDNTIYLIQTVSAFPGEYNVRAFSGDDLSLLRSSGNITGPGNNSGRGQCISIMWQGIRAVDGLVQEFLLVNGEDELTVMPALTLVETWGINWNSGGGNLETRFAALGGVGGLRQRVSCTVGPDGRGWGVMRNSGGSGADGQLYVFQINPLADSAATAFLKEYLIDITATNFLGPCHAAYSWDIDRVCIFLDADNTTEQWIISVDPETGAFEEALLSTNNHRFHSGPLTMEGRVGGPPNGEWWIGRKNDEAIFDLVDWKTMSIIDTCNFGDTPDPDLGLTPFEGAYVEPNTRCLVAQQIGPDPVGTAFIWCDGGTPNDTNLCEVTKKVGAKVGYDLASQMDCTAVASVVVRGAILEAPGPAKGFLQVMYSLHACLLYDSGYKTKARIRGGSPSVTLTEGDDYGVSPRPGNFPTRLLERRHRREKSYPRLLNLDYRDSTKDYQAWGVSHSFPIEVFRGKEETQEVYPGTLLDETEAKFFAKRRIKLLHLNQKGHKLDCVPLAWLFEMGEIIAVEHKGQTLNIEVHKSNLRNDLVTEVEGVLWAQGALTNAAVGQPSPIVNEVFIPKAFVEPEIIDAPLPIDTAEHVTSPVRFPIIAIAAGESQTGTVIEQSPNGVDGWTLHSFVPADAITQQGSLQAALPAGSTTTFDRTNTIDVTIKAGTLTSAASEAAVLADPELNAFLIKADDGAWEWGQYVNVSNTADNRWSISTLRRGRRNTENHLAHKIGSRIYFPTQATFGGEPFEAAKIGVPVFFRAYPAGQGPSGKVFSHTPVGRSKMPYSGNNITNKVRGTAPLDWAWKWTSRSRFQAPVLLGKPPMGENIYSFEVDLLNIAGDASSALLTLTMTADFDADTGTFTGDVGSTSTFTRASGSFVTDGFKQGQEITTSGYTDGANNGTFIIATVAALTITITTTPLVAESGGGNEQIQATGSIITANQTTRIQDISVTEAEQVTAYGSAQSSMPVAIYQLSDIVGRGEPFYATITE
jgi:hypothetical protein